MQTSSDFMGEFLRAEQQLRLRCVKLEKDLWAKFGLNGFCFSEIVRDARSCEPEEFQQSEDTVTVTAMSPSYHLTRARFMLVQPKREWRIAGVGYFCKICAGTGKTISPKNSGMASVCSICEGEGYFVPANLKVAQQTNASPGAEIRSPRTDLDHFMHQFLVAERTLIARQLELANEMWASFAMAHLRPPYLSAAKRQWDDQTMIHTFRETANGAVVIATVVRSWQSEERLRYSLSRRDNAWWISSLEYACPNCSGFGSYVVEKDGGTREEMACLVCRGKAWFPREDSETESAG